MAKKQQIIDIPEEELDMFTKYGVKTIIKGNKKLKLKKAKSICGKPNCLEPDNCIYPMCQH